MSAYLRTGPARLPGLWVVSADAEADLHRAVKASVRREEHDGGRLHRVVWGKDDPAVVNPSVKIGVGRAPDREVPLKQVCL